MIVEGLVEVKAVVPLTRYINDVTSAFIFRFDYAAAVKTLLGCYVWLSDR